MKVLGLGWLLMCLASSALADAAASSGVGTAAGSNADADAEVAYRQAIRRCEAHPVRAVRIECLKVARETYERALREAKSPR